MTACAELFKENLESKGLHYVARVDSDGDDVIIFPYKGREVRMFFYGEEGSYLSLYMVYENVPEDRITDAVFLCNEINTEYKWVTFYLDKDRDIIVHDDAILTTDNAADEAFELLVRLIQISDGAKNRVMKMIFG